MAKHEYDMRIRLAFGTSGRGERDCRLSIEDRSSGIRILEAVLDAEHLMAMMGGGTAEVLAWFTPHPERIGRKHEHDQLLLDAYNTSKTDAEKDAEAWRVENGWDTVEMSRNNNGQWVITGRRYVAESTEES